VECTTISARWSNTPLCPTANNQSQKSYSRLDYDSLEQIVREILDPRTIINFSGVDRHHYNSLYGERQSALAELQLGLSERILQDADALTQPYNQNRLRGFNELMQQAQSMPNEAYRVVTINALHQLVPENVLRRFNEYDREIDEAILGTRGARRTYDRLNDLFNSICNDLNLLGYYRRMGVVQGRLPVVAYIYGGLH
jgi:hypothetical protein